MKGNAIFEWQELTEKFQFFLAICHNFNVAIPPPTNHGAENQQEHFRQWLKYFCSLARNPEGD